MAKFLGLSLDQLYETCRVMNFRHFVNRQFIPFRQWRMRKVYRTMGGGACSVLGNNCVAGMLCHDLGLRFDTPTVNLAFTFQEFLTLAENLPCSMSAYIEKSAETEPFPVGLLKVDGATPIRLKFIHYKTFDESVDAWRRRTARVNMNRVVLLATGNSNASPEDIALALPYPKLCYTQDTETARLLGRLRDVGPRTVLRWFRNHRVFRVDRSSSLSLRCRFEKDDRCSNRNPMNVA